jgi:ribosome-associated toxin RatA of RatAB toxin-antitoxin module
MPRHEEQTTLAYGADELFAVVADVKDYPLFVPVVWRGAYST